MNKAGRRTGKEPSFFPVHLLFFTRDAGPASVIRCCRADFINKNAKTELELECEKAFLMCRPICGEKGIPPAGIRRLHELFRRPEAVSVLEDIYNFRVQDLYQLTGKHLYCDKMWNKRLEKALEDCQRLQDKVERLEEENKNQKRLIQEYAESTTWKIMAPFREVGRAVKKMSAINKKMS